MQRYGESEQAGVAFKGKLVHAAHRPQQIVFGQEAFPTLWEKAGALVQSLIQGHVFFNGNKRTAFAVMQLFLFINGYRIDMDEESAEEMIVSFVTNEEFKGDHGVGNIGVVIMEVAKRI